MERTDDFNAYRDMCANRLRRLERYKKARSFCSLEEDKPSTAQLPNRHSEIPSSAPAYTEEDRFFSAGEPKENSAFDLIRQKMFALMENDVTLLQQLLSLGDQVSEMKGRGERRRSLSISSLDRQGEQDEMEDQFDEPPFSASMSAVTNLFVDDSRPQYFSRQNSVLRIPIPPRSSNRFGGNSRVPRRPSDALRVAPSRNLRIQVDDSASESSDGPLSPLSHTPSIVSSKSSMTYSSSSASDVAVKIGKSRSSNSSIDSGIRDAGSSASPSPTFEREV